MLGLDSVLGAGFDCARLGRRCQRNFSHSVHRGFAAALNTDRCRRVTGNNRLGHRSASDGVIGVMGRDRSGASVRHKGRRNSGELDELHDYEKKGR